jgi:nicotinate-nucleotide adenylyltransferase
MPVTTFSNSFKIGFFGGSFDPIHRGHLSVALTALEKFNLHKILLCPAFFAPLRKEKPLFSPKDRLAMVGSLTQEHSQLEMFDHEIISGNTCYTYNTLQSAQKIYPKSEIFLMLGDDQFNQFDYWKFHQEILKEFSLIVFNRIKAEKGKTFFERFPSAKIFALGNQLIPYSSTEIRKNIETGRDISQLVPSSVLSYMQQNQLFDLNTL